MSSQARKLVICQLNPYKKNQKHASSYLCTCFDLTVCQYVALAHFKRTKIIL